METAEDLKRGRHPPLEYLPDLKKVVARQGRKHFEH